MISDNTHEVFSRLQSETLCPFARVARVDFARTITEGMSMDEGSEQLHQDIVRYIESNMAASPDGLVVEIEKGTMGEDFDGQIKEFLSLYRALKYCDGTTDEELASDNISDPSWQFTIHGQRLFVNFFSSAYPKDNSRHLPDSDLVILFLQPEQSFSTRIPHDIGSEELARFKAAIRLRFANAGLAYDGAITDDQREAAKYILPRQMGEKIIEWWNQKN